MQVNVPSMQFVPSLYGFLNKVAFPAAALPDQMFQAII
jgi:hypothetical protein